MDTPVAEEVVLGGRYRLHSLLGSGGMAVVYDGWDQRLARPVAVKLLRPDLAAVPDLRRRFEFEARAAARLTHPNVVAVFDAGEDRGRSYIVMERLRGESLADSIGHGPVDAAWLGRLAGEVLAALGAAHEAGIVHRDIKPGNILLGPDGRAKVADFGIASVVESPAAAATAAAETAAALTGTGLVLGTPAYLAPERAMGHPATPQSDLYSLGVVLYEALTGSKPFAGATPAAIAAAAVQGAAQDPSLLRPDADPQLVAVIGRAMALDPAHRYATAAEMAADLRRQAPPPTAIMPAAPAGAGPGAGGGAPPRPVPPTLAATPATEDWRHHRLPPPVRRRRRRMVAAFAVAAVVLLGLAVIAANPGSGTRASSTPTVATTAPAQAQTKAPSASASARSATTPPTVVGASRTDPVAVALLAVATRLAHSKSAAAGQLAAGLQNVATADPASRATAATSLLDQATQWYRQRQLTTSDYVVAGGVLGAAGAPPATVAPRTTGGSGDGGD
ncbi:MAG: serine/threonine protein kinase [Actinomycetota bacterium]|nr:serine/threonine protein kinase [Actinomycetota bacterium]